MSRNQNINVQITKLVKEKEARIETIMNENEKLRELCRILNRTAVNFHKDSKDYIKSSVMWNELITPHISETHKQEIKHHERI